MTRRALLYSAGLLLLAAFAGSVWSAEEREAENRSQQPIGRTFEWLNFALVAGAAAYGIAKYGPAYFRGRADAIASAIAQAASVKAEADRRLAQAEAKLKRLGEEIEALRETAQRYAADEAERIRKMTRQELEKIAQAARTEIEAAERAARLDLKAEAAKLAVARAEALLTVGMTSKTQEELFRTFVAELPGRAN
jgi:F0F1-type ATP synthase membrane subunit b/b'